MFFVDLEKAFNTVPDKMVMNTMRWMGAPESEVKMLEAMYENTKARVVVGSGMSNKFQVHIGLRQGSALKSIAFHLSNGTNQHEDKHNRCAEEEYVRRRSEYMEKRGGGNGGQKDFQKTEVKVLDSCVVPASTYGLETLALSELHQHKLQVGLLVRFAMSPKRVWRDFCVQIELGVEIANLGRE